jgi:S1-C subfamily serine protease
MFTLAVALLLAASPAQAQRTRSPADAAVYVRLIGSAHVEISGPGVMRVVDVDDVEIGTGSGFVISPYGYVLTNHHVVSGIERSVVTRGTEQSTITLKVSRIDVCFRPEAVAARELISPCSPASVTASDPELDLAVLFVSAPNLPYIALGDSDAVAAGLAVDALGYPFGRQVEVGRVVNVPDLVPDVSTTPGAVSALRADDTGQRRFLQITNSLNPGNSGGPVVDRDGFAVGVIRMRLENATGIGFAIPINQVKDFLEANGLDQLMPVRRLRLGGFRSIDAKKIGLRLPEGLFDVSPFPSRVETNASPVDIALRIDRVLSPWTASQLQQSLIGTDTFEAAAMTAREGRTAPPSGNPPLLLGGALGRATDTNQEIRMEHAVLDLGSEKLVARYVGPAEWMAFNESVLRQSLTSLQGQRFVVGALVPVEKLEWSTVSPTANGQSEVMVPTGWVATPGAPSPCPGLPQPGTVTAAFPQNDFTLVSRAAVWSTGNVVPDTAAAACSSRRGSLGGASYSSRADWLGVPYVIEGVFVRTGPGRVAQLEVLSTEQRSPFARTLLAAWLKKTTE